MTHGSVQPLESRTIHQIQSGQVIVDLCSVVKELLENSLDAGATSVEIRLRDYGVEAIEVQDNGSGIAAADYAAVALKHHTSKLSDYAGLARVKTFGFRGEALSSLCALSNLSVVTAREEEAPRATRLEFDFSGKLQSQTVCAAQRGTTVFVEQLFSSLPVRRRELAKHGKREYGKVIAQLQAYACIAREAKISVVHINSKGKRDLVFATKSTGSYRDNISGIFGARSVASLSALDLSFETNPSRLAEAMWVCIRACYAFDQVDHSIVRIEGFVSGLAHGEGRQMPDRQMFFVNARPCNLPQVAKAFNEVYKTYNPSQSPFVFANVLLDTDAYDVNVSPDKRTILLHDQAALLDALKTSLANVLAQQSHALPQTQCRPSPNSQDTPSSRSSVPELLIPSLPRAKTVAAPRPESTETHSHIKQEPAASQWPIFSQKTRQTTLRRADTAPSRLSVVFRANPQETPPDEDIMQEEESKSDESGQSKADMEEAEIESREDDEEEEEADNESHEDKDGYDNDEDQVATLIQHAESSRRKEDRESIERKWQKLQTSTLTLDLCQSVSPSVADIAKRMKQGKVSKEQTQEIKAEISKDVDAVMLTISKADFQKMTIIGQFNLGFILARRNEDIFVIDQHASDEKINFERLQATTVMEPQRIVCPQRLSLTAVEEEVVRSSLDVIAKNGFGVEIDESAAVGQSVLLNAFPTSKETTYNLHDFEELISLLTEGSGSSSHVPRPSRTRKIFAMRACRSSIMIGKVMTLKQMQSLVQRLGDIDKPWNCPHGRPTMRHVCSLRGVLSGMTGDLTP